MSAPPSYAESSHIDQKYPPTFQQPQGYSAFAPASSFPQTNQQPAFPLAPQPGFPPAQGAPGNSNIVMMGLVPYENIQTANGTEMVRRVLGKSSSTLTCQFCNERIQTKTEEGSLHEMLTDAEWRMTKCVWIFLLVLSPLWLFIPLCIYMCTQPLSMVKHTCPRCNTCLGIHHSGGDHFFYTAGSPEAQYAAAAAMMRQQRSR